MSDDQYEPTYSDESCGVLGPAIREEDTGTIITRYVCKREPGHDGVHRQGNTEWGKA